MSTSNFSRMAGLGAILTGAFRLIQVVVEFSSNRAGIFDSKAWDYLTFLAAVLILILTLGLKVLTGRDAAVDTSQQKAV